MKDYHINIFYSDEDGGIYRRHSRFESLFGMRRDAGRALREVERAKAAWLETARAEGKPIPEPTYRPVIYQSS
jgi:hypothetical protein